jgi:hypothetical protein
MCIISLTELTEAQAKEVWAAELAQQQRDLLVKCHYNAIHFIERYVTVLAKQKPSEVFDNE